MAGMLLNVIGSLVHGTIWYLDTGDILKFSGTVEYLQPY